LSLRIPKHHPLLPYSANVMLSDCRQILARQLKTKRKIERAGGKFEVRDIAPSLWLGYTRMKEKSNEKVI